MKKHKLLSISAVIMMLSVYGCSLDEFNPSGISTEQEWSTPAGYEKKVNDCYFDLVRIVYGQSNRHLSNGCRRWNRHLARYESRWYQR